MQQQVVGGKGKEPENKTFWILYGKIDGENRYHIQFTKNDDQVFDEGTSFETYEIQSTLTYSNIKDTLDMIHTMAPAWQKPHNIDLRESITMDDIKKLGTVIKVQ